MGCINGINKDDWSIVHEFSTKNKRSTKDILCLECAHALLKDKTQYYQQLLEDIEQKKVAIQIGK